MRVLKFRAWDKTYSVMEDDVGPTLAGDGVNGIFEDAQNTRMVVEQYTGLKDKNGKEIYEGDIVHYSYHPGTGMWNHEQNGIIKWENTGFFFHGIPGGLRAFLCSIPGFFGPKVLLVEVIGNIHENPELLREG